MKFHKCIWPLHIVSVKVNTVMALVKENKIFICQTSRIISMNLIYHISEYRDDTFYNDYTKIMYYAVEKSMVRYNNLLRRMCKDKFDDVDISVLSTIADDLFRDKTCNWGRIISPFTFCGTLAKQSASKDMYKTIDDSTPSTIHHIHNTTHNTQHTTYINLHTSHYTHHTQQMFHHTHQSTHITLHTSHSIHHTCSTTRTHTSLYIQHITHIELHTTHHTA